MEVGAVMVVLGIVLLVVGWVNFLTATPARAINACQKMTVKFFPDKEGKGEETSPGD